MTMTKLLQKRGPDHIGYMMTPHCLMGHTRLAIIDLKNGNQPILYTHHEKTYRMTYNGEIYNMKMCIRDRCNPSLYARPGITRPVN